jgi:hypothetical protein
MDAIWANPGWIAASVIYPNFGWARVEAVQ